MCGTVWPCGCVSTLGPFGPMGSIGHLVFRLDAAADSYCTKGKQLIGWSTGWLSYWMQ